MKLNKKIITVLFLCFGFVLLFNTQLTTPVYAVNIEHGPKAKEAERICGINPAIGSEAEKVKYQICYITAQKILENPNLDANDYCSNSRFGSHVGLSRDEARQACESSVTRVSNPPFLSSDEIFNYCKSAANKTNCINALNAKKCTNKACADAEVKKSGGLVVSFCRNTANPQQCQKTYRDTCGGKTGTALKTCQNTVAAKNNAPIPNPDVAGAGTTVNADSTVSLNSEYFKPKNTCGSGDRAFKTQINFGCTGKVENPIIDLAYALIKFLSIGVGLVLIGSMIYAGIMYTMSGGSPEKTTEAKNRIRDAVIALVFYLLIFAMVQFLVPGGLFNG